MNVSTCVLCALHLSRLGWGAHATHLLAADDEQYPHQEEDRVEGREEEHLAVCAWKRTSRLGGLTWTRVGPPGRIDKGGQSKRAAPTSDDSVIADEPAPLPVAGRIDCLDLEEDLDLRVPLAIAASWEIERWSAWMICTVSATQACA